MAKKQSSAKSKAANKKVSKPAAKPVAKKLAVKKMAKPAVKAPVKKAVPVAAKSKSAVQKTPPVQSEIATKKPKAKVVEETVEDYKPVKNQSVVSMIESEGAVEEPSKAEKTSKVKPVKIERGNLADEKAKWAELFKKYGKDKAINYKMSEKFSPMIPMQHKVLGWGFVLTNENDRLEVLFETGIRMLISNYKT